MKTARVALLVLAFLAAAPFQSSAAAQTWPVKPVKIIAVFPPGGSVDQVARILAQQLVRPREQAAHSPQVM